MRWSIKAYALEIFKGINGTTVSWSHLNQNGLMIERINVLKRDMTIILNEMDLPKTYTDKLST